MRRNAKIEDGFMVPLEEQGDDDNLAKKASKSTGANNNNNNDRIKSPKKGISTASRKESVHVKAGDPKHNWKMVREVVGFNNETPDDKVVSSVSSESFEVATYR